MDNYVPDNVITRGAYVCRVNSLPNLSGRILDVYCTSTHGVAVVHI